MERREKKGMMIDYIGWMLLGLGALILAGVAIYLAYGKGSGMIDFIKNLFRFGGGP